MTRTGLTIESPKTGQAITFVRTSGDSDGAELVIEALMAPGAFIPSHRHLHQAEAWEVLEGTGTFTVAGETRDVEPGERLLVPAGTAHRFRNRSRSVVKARATLTPALRSEELFERLFTLGSQGKVNRIGAPSPLIGAQLIREFRDEFFYLAALPVSLQRLIAGTRP
jgi:mannose-6-phosphate isomerase-like protein (cupin superfamily)